MSFRIWLKNDAWNDDEINLFANPCHPFRNFLCWPNAHEISLQFDVADNRLRCLVSFVVYENESNSTALWLNERRPSTRKKPIVSHVQTRRNELSLHENTYWHSTLHLCRRKLNAKLESFRIWLVFQATRVRSAYLRWIINPYFLFAFFSLRSNKNSSNSCQFLWKYCTNFPLN